MNRINLLATEHPLAFGLTVTVVYILITILSALLGAVWPGEPYGQYIGGTIGRVISIVILLMALARLAWLRPAGFTRPGRPQAWLIGLVLLAYWIPVSAYAVTGNVDFSISDPALLSVLILFFLELGFLEEIAFRGLIQYALVRAWGNTNRGPIKSVLVSALFFGAMHVIYIISGTPLPALSLQMLETFFLGIFLGALVLHGSSIYPAVLFHGIANLAAFLNLQANSFDGIPTSTWPLICLLMLPPALFGLYLLRGLPERSTLPATT
jgi:membrane protease YdiL (CAAX protease family)